MPKGIYLEHLTWAEAEPLLRADPLVVIPVGAATKEHGPHLPLDTDRLMATISPAGSPKRWRC